MLTQLHSQKHARGSAIFLALVMATAALALLLGVLQLSSQNVVKHEQYFDREKSFLAAQGMLRAVFTDKWTIINANNEYNPLTGLGVPYRAPGDTFKNQFGPADRDFNVQGLDSYTVGSSTLYAPKGYTELVDNGGLPYVGKKIGDCYIVDVSARWHQQTGNTSRFYLTLQVTAQHTPFDPNNPTFHMQGDVPATVAETYELNQSSNSPVAQYVELAKNVSCSLCHTSFDNVYNYYNQKVLASDAVTTPEARAAAKALAYDPTLKSSKFGRVKVASLGSFQVRDNSSAVNAQTGDAGRFFPSQSYLNGTFYSRGNIQDASHNLLNSVDPSALQGAVMDSTNVAQVGTLYSGGNLFQDNLSKVPLVLDQTTGQATPTNLVAITNDVNGVPTQKYGNLYLNYPTSDKKMIDGQVPLDFPFPFQDLSKNKLVTDADVAQKLQDNTDNANAKKITPNITGGISGGYSMVVSKGSTYNNSALPVPGVSTGLAPAESVGSTGVVDGNLILIGTKDNPVNIDKQTIVKGDIIIKGYYQGEGSLWASGNIYLPSDLQYRNRPLADVNGVVQKNGDGTPIEDFGVGQGGKQNLGGLISGGTIVIGDYLTSSVSNSGVNPDGSQMKDALGNPVFQSSAYVNNQPPDAFDPTQFPAGNFPIVDSAGRQNRENGFPLVPTYQKADPSFQYSFFNLDPASGQYKLQTTPLFAKNFTLSQMEVFNRDQWAPTQPILPAADGTFSQTNSTYNAASPYLPRYYVLNAGDPVTAYVYGKQSTNPAVLSADATNRSDSDPNHAAGTFWDDKEGIWKGGENSKIYDTVTVGGASVDSTGTPLPAGAGSLVDGKQTHMVYAPLDPTQPASATNPANRTLIDSTDPTKSQKAAVIAINPDWIPTDKMWNILLNEEWSRKANDSAAQAVYKATGETPAETNRDGTPFRVDGMLYTNNAIFGIQRNRALAPQAPGDYQSAVKPDGTPYVSDTTQPGPWPTITPTTTFANDNYNVTQLQDIFSLTVSQDTYTHIPYTDQYTRQRFVDNYQQIQYRDNYTRTPYVDNYTRVMDTDKYTRTQYVDNYSKNVSTDVWKQPDTTTNTTTRTYQVFIGSGYGRQGPFTVTQVSPPATLTTPTTYNGQAVTGSTFTDSVSTTTTPGASTSVIEPALPPAGYTIKVSSSTTAQTSNSTAYYAAGGGPAVPAGWSKTGTTTTPQTSNSSAYVHGSTPPTLPTPGWALSTTTSVTQTSNSATYYDPANPPGVPTPGWSKTGTTTGATQTATSGTYTNPGSPPATPTGYTKTGTTTTTATSVSAAYFTGQATPAVPAGWTFVSTTATTQTSNSATYANPATPPAVPTPGWSKTGTTASATVTTTSTTYVGAPPSVPAGYTKVSTATTTSTYANTIYYQGNPSPAPPSGGYVYVKTNNLGTKLVTVPFGSAAPSPSATKLAPTNPTYAYPTGTAAGKAASDFRRYAKEQESSSRGRLMINGAVMAPDLGLLVTGRVDPSGKYKSNLILNYDNRVTRLLSLPSTQKYPWNVSLIGWTRLDPNESTQ